MNPRPTKNLVGPRPKYVGPHDVYGLVGGALRICTAAKKASAKSSLVMEVNPLMIPTIREVGPDFKIFTGLNKRGYPIDQA